MKKFEIKSKKKFNNSKIFGVNKKNIKLDKKKNYFLKGGTKRRFTNFSISSSKIFRVYDAIVSRRSKLLKRLYKLNNKTYSSIIWRYPNFKWLKDNRIIWGLNKYRRLVNALESQGLKRKVYRKRLKSYGLALLEKQKLKNYYYGLKEYTLKKIISQVFFYKYNHLIIFATLLESRLIAFLERTCFFKTINQIKIFVKLGYVKLNGRVVKDTNLLLNIGDKISFNFSKKKNFYTSISLMNFLKKKFLFFIILVAI